MNFHISLIAGALLLGCGICLSEGIQESFPRVTTPLGIIEGTYQNSSSGRRFESYQGIPYAYAPTGKLRFEVAKPRDTSWTGILMAKRFGPACLQYNNLPLNPAEMVEGSEDCLYINVYAPTRDANAKLRPVIFFIHGGAFQFGSGSLYGPKYVLDNDVILVTFNHRLGPLGFLSTENDVVPGNMGLKDQVVALRWVRDNIKSFGGDPSRVTIFGHSSGGASAHYHYLSKLSAGLFQRGWSLSGTALDCWTQTENSLEKAKKLSAIVGCPTEDLKRMVKCLKDRPAVQIVQAVGDFMPWLYNPFAPFGPVVEKGRGKFTFLDRSPVEIIASGGAQDIPWITGVVSADGLYPVAEFVASDELLKELNDNWETIAPHLLDFNYTIPQTEHAKVARLIKKHYLGDGPIDKTTVNQITQMVGDRLYVHDGEKAARLQAKANKSPVRFYHFSYRGAHSVTEVLTGTNEDFGVCHLDDLAYVLDAYFDSTTTEKDREMQKKLTNLWVSYATYGTPDAGIDWPILNESAENLPNLHIAGPGKFSVENKLNIGEEKFWNGVYFKENIIES